MSAPILPHVVRQHIREAASCYERRRLEDSLLTLEANAREDLRLAAHLDGLATAGADGDALIHDELSGEPDALATVPQ